LLKKPIHKTTIDIKNNSKKDGSIMSSEYNDGGNLRKG
jgi:hypothetical protein